MIEPEEARGESDRDEAEPAAHPLLEPGARHLRMIATAAAVLAILLAAFMRCG